MKLLILFGAATLFFVNSSLSVAQSNPPLRNAVVFINCEYHYDDGRKEKANTGSGAVISPDGFVITAKHVIPQPIDGAAVVCTGALGSRHKYPLPLMKQPARNEADIVLFVLPDLGEPYKHFTMCDPRRLTVGASAITAFGFPLDLDFQIKLGVISGRNGPGGTWHTDIPLTFGMSGGPVVNEDGHIIGTVAGGTTPGFNNFLPIFFARTLTDIARTPDCDSENVESVELPDVTVTRTYDLSITKDDHPNFKPHERTYSFDYLADAEFIIESANFRETSANNRKQYWHSNIGRQNESYLDLHSHERPALRPMAGVASRPTRHRAVEKALVGLFNHGKPRRTTFFE